MTTAPPPTTATTQSPTTPLATLSPELENNALQVTLDEFSAATVSVVHHSFLFNFFDNNI